MQKELTPDEEVEAARVARLMKSNKPATLKDLDLVLAVVAKRFREMERDMAARFAIMEENSLSYEGTFAKSQHYSKGSLVTHKGGLWHCQEPTWDEPGTSSAWKLTAKTPQARGSR